MIVQSFQQKIISWYLLNKRDLPWRHTKDPYFIWLSEVILQQTRVKQGLPYYEKFIERFPKLNDLAKAEEQEVLRLWQGLGYYSRARNMHTTAQWLNKNYSGEFPGTYKELLRLKGIGPYTAAAIASFAFEEKVAVLDGNVYRVLSRVFGIDIPINSKEGEKLFRELSLQLLPENQTSTYNQAMMEFGAMQCSPQKPNCLFCPLSDDCQAKRLGKQENWPVKLKKTKVRERFFHYAVLLIEGKIGMRKRNNEDIWGGLYDFDLYEGEQLMSWTQLTEIGEFSGKQKHLKMVKESREYTHILTHQRIRARFWHLEITNPEQFKKVADTTLSFYSPEEAMLLPKPILIDKYLKEIFF